MFRCEELIGSTEYLRGTLWPSSLRHCATRSRVRFPMVPLEFFI